MTQNRPKSVRIAHINTGVRGGAAVAAIRQHEAQTRLGLDSKFYVAEKIAKESRAWLALPHELATDPEPGQFLQIPGMRQSRGLQGYEMRRYPRRDESREMFSFLSRGVEMASLSLDDRDIIHLHWVAHMTDPALEPHFYGRRPLVWTLHDMNPLTGGCHHADECDRFMEFCGCCPHLGSDDPEDASFWTWFRRKQAYDNLNMHIICPSEWMAGRVRASSLLGTKPISVIPNSVPVSIFRPKKRSELRRKYGILDNELAVLFISQKVCNCRKGGDLLQESLQRLAGTALGPRLHILLLGDDAPQSFLSSGLKVSFTGYVDDPATMADFYGCADAVLLPSLAENLPNVISEALACGTPCVAFAVGGIPEMLDHEQTGYLAVPGSVDGLISGIFWADAVRDGSSVRQMCRDHAVARWNSTDIAIRHANLYATLAPALLPL